MRRKHKFQKWLIAWMVLCMCIAGMPNTTLWAAEKGSTISTAVSVTFGTNYSKGWTASNDENDFFNKLTVKNRGVLIIYVGNPTDDYGEIGCMEMELYNSNGDIVWEADTEAQIDTGKKTCVYKVGVAAGTYYLNLTPLFSVTSGTITHSYSVSYKQTNDWEVESNNIAESATSLTLGKMYSGFSGEEGYYNENYDIFEVKLTKGASYYICFDNYQKLQQAGCVIDLFGPNDEVVSLDGLKKKQGDYTCLEYTAKSGGTYYIQLNSEEVNAGIEYKIGVLEPEVEKPGKATIATIQNGKGQVELTWKAVKNATGYNVYRSTDGKSFSKIRSTTTTAYADKNVKNGKKYYYKICAYNKVNSNAVAGDQSAAKSITYTYVTPAKIKSLAATKDGLKVTWSKVADADGYIVYRSDNQGTYHEVKKITKAATTSYSDTAAKTNGAWYGYKIVAYQNNGDKLLRAEASDEEIIYRLNAPTLSKVTASTTGNALTWTVNKKAKGYIIYRSVDGGEFERVGTVTNSGTKTWTDKQDLTKGKKYSYQVTAYYKNDGVVYESLASDKKTVTAKVTKAGTAADKPLDSVKLYEKCSKSIVEVNAGIALGSGFYIDDYTVITNYHVIDGATALSAKLIDETPIEVTKVIGYDEDLDIAILGVKQKGTPLKRNTHGVTMGETTYTIGSSLGLTNTFSNGMVSNPDRYLDGVHYIQTNTAISHGNSGGPLLNAYGEVIGITTAYFADGQNLNIAINIDQVDLVDQSNPMTTKAFIAKESGASAGGNAAGSTPTATCPMLGAPDEAMVQYVQVKNIGSKKLVLEGYGVALDINYTDYNCNFGLFDENTYEDLDSVTIAPGATQTLWLFFDNEYIYDKDTVYGFFANYDGVKYYMYVFASDNSIRFTVPEK